MLRVLGDYFNLSLSSETSHNGSHPLFSASLRSISRDVIVIKEFIVRSCPTLRLKLRESGIYVSVFLAEKILNQNLELFKEPNSQYFCNTLFLLSLSNKDTGNSDFGWRLLLFSTLKGLEELERVAVQENWVHSKHISMEMIEERLVGLMGRDSKFVRDMFEEFVDPSKGEGGFFSFLSKPILGAKGLSKQEALNFGTANSGRFSPVLAEEAEKNRWVYNVVQSIQSLHSLVAMIKPETSRKVRKINLLVHKLHHKKPKNVVYKLGVEPLNELMMILEDSFLSFKSEEDNLPLLKLKLLQEGSSVFALDNYEEISSISLQTKRFRPNVIHPLTLTFKDITNPSARIIITCSLLIQEEDKNSAKLPLCFKQEEEDRFHQSLRNITQDRAFKHGKQAVHIEGLYQDVFQRLSAVLEDVDAGVTLQAFTGLYHT